MILLSACYQGGLFDHDGSPPTHHSPPQASSLSSILCWVLSLLLLQANAPPPCCQDLVLITLILPRFPLPYTAHSGLPSLGTASD